MYEPSLATAMPSYLTSATNSSSQTHTRLTPSLLLQNAVIAVTHADAHDQADRIRDASVMWYVYVVDVEDDKQRLKVLSPISGRVPGNAMVWGTWPEGVPDLGSMG
jgi:polyribonucleotide 5'-hydroxyl-kinase